MPSIALSITTYEQMWPSITQYFFQKAQTDTKTVILRLSSDSTIRYQSYITVTSQWVGWHLKSPASRLFTQPFIQTQFKTQFKEDIKAPRGIHRSPVNSPHKGPVTWKMFPFDDVIMNNVLQSRLQVLNTNISQSFQLYQPAEGAAVVLLPGFAINW